MSKYNHRIMINDAIKIIESSPNEVAYGKTAQNFILSALRSILSVDGRRSLTRVSAGNDLSHDWIFYESGKLGLCNLNYKTLHLKVEVINAINDPDDSIKQNMFRLFDALIAQLDIDATINYASNEWTKNVLVDRLSAIEALESAINQPLRVSGDVIID